MAFWHKSPYKSQTGVSDLFWLGLIVLIFGFGIGYFYRQTMEPGMSTDRVDLVFAMTAIIAGGCWLGALLRRV